MVHRGGRQGFTSKGFGSSLQGLRPTAGTRVSKDQVKDGLAGPLQHAATNARDELVFQMLRWEPA